MDELRRKNCSLVKEVERLTMQAEKPLEHQSLSVSSCMFLILNWRWWQMRTLQKQLC